MVLAAVVVVVVVVVVVEGGVPTVAEDGGKGSDPVAGAGVGAGGVTVVEEAERTPRVEWVLRRDRR